MIVKFLLPLKKGYPINLTDEMKKHVIANSCYKEIDQDLLPILQDADILRKNCIENPSIDNLTNYIDIMYQFNEKFPENLNFEFKWDDAFNNKKYKCGLFKFEVGCILFNLAVLYYNNSTNRLTTALKVNAGSNKIDDEVLKQCFKNYSLSANIFSYLKLNFCNERYKDLSSSCMEVLENIARGSSNICILKRYAGGSVNEKQLISYYAYCDVSFSKALEYMLTVTPGYFPKNIVENVTLLRNYARAMSYFYMSRAEPMSHKITRLKEAKSFLDKHVKKLSPKDNPTLHRLYKTITDDYNTSVEDNNKIYYKVLAEKDQLAKIIPAEPIKVPEFTLPVTPNQDLLHFVYPKQISDAIFYLKASVSRILEIETERHKIASEEREKQLIYYNNLNIFDSKSDVNEISSNDILIQKLRTFNSSGFGITQVESGLETLEQFKINIEKTISTIHGKMDNLNKCSNYQIHGDISNVVSIFNTRKDNSIREISKYVKIKQVYCDNQTMLKQYNYNEESILNLLNGSNAATVSKENMINKIFEASSELEQLEKDRVLLLNKIKSRDFVQPSVNYFISMYKERNLIDVENDVVRESDKLVLPVQNEINININKQIEIISKLNMDTSKIKPQKDTKSNNSSDYQNILSSLYLFEDFKDSISQQTQAFETILNSLWRTSSDADTILRKIYPNTAHMVNQYPIQNVQQSLQIQPNSQPASLRGIPPQKPVKTGVKSAPYPVNTIDYKNAPQYRNFNPTSNQNVSYQQNTHHPNVQTINQTQYNPAAPYESQPNVFNQIPRNENPTQIMNQSTSFIPPNFEPPNYYSNAFNPPNPHASKGKYGKKMLHIDYKGHVTIDQILSDVYGTIKLKEFLISESSEENLLFITDVLNFKLVDDDKVQECAKFISNNYLRCTVKNEINIEQRIKDECVKLVDDEKCNREMFDECMQEVKTLIKRSSFDRFLDSKYYTTYLNSYTLKRDKNPNI
ncbi:hypothetical protein A3Q56_05750 [Intoshia linei]|uniref:BRO1 domain-containing protein n=1 Tax=Intoshia linei TaxID=1819745 RepID=A0A177AX13_9BILA|nr:hypothetical protein A3Q56_05750 [Intoshia linei]